MEALARIRFLGFMNRFFLSQIYCLGEKAQ